LLPSQLSGSGSLGGQQQVAAASVAKLCGRLRSQGVNILPIPASTKKFLDIFLFENFE
jgi:hypothetical protein